jgi:predicted metal-dependent RNase
METTRGDFARAADYSRRAEKERLATVISDTFDAGGSVLIPVFALGKTQEVMMMLHELHEQDLIPEMPVFIGGLSTKITVLYDHYAERVPRHYPGFRLLEDVRMLVAPRRKRKQLVYQPRSIFALSSGMMTEGTTSNQFGWRFLNDPKNTICFVGYTDPESPGYRIRNAKEGDMIRMDEKLPPTQLRCRVESFDFSAHATRETLADYAEKVRPRKVLLVHGEEPAQQWFINRFAQTLPQTEVIRPDRHEVVELW